MGVAWNLLPYELVPSVLASTCTLDRTGQGTRVGEWDGVGAKWWGWVVRDGVLVRGGVRRGGEAGRGRMVWWGGGENEGEGVGEGAGGAWVKH